MRFRGPAGFVPVRFGVQAWWMSEQDRIAHDRDDSSTPLGGFFSVTLSMNVGYDRVRGVFFGGGEGAGEGMETRRGWRRGTRRRAWRTWRSTGMTWPAFPMLFVEGRQGDRRITMCYIATGIDTNVVFLLYVHPTPYREVDGQRWGEMRRAIVSLGGSCARRAIMADRTAGTALPRGFGSFTHSLGLPRFRPSVRLSSSVYFRPCSPNCASATSR